MCARSRSKPKRSENRSSANNDPRRANKMWRAATRLEDPSGKRARARDEKRQEDEETENYTDVLPGRRLIGCRMSRRKNEKENKQNREERPKERMATAPFDLFAEPDHAPMVAEASEGARSVSLLWDKFLHWRRRRDMRRFPVAIAASARSR